MSLALTSPVTGGAQTGLTSPTYTISLDGATTNGYTYTVTALGGTQTGVNVAAASKPFKIILERPSFFRKMPSIGLTGLVTGSGKNVWRIRVLKGALPLTTANAEICEFDGLIKIPAGADLNDAVNVRAGLSLWIGAMNQISSSLGDSLISGAA
jgi:hypothetical protein